MILPPITAPIWYAHEKLATAVHSLAASDTPMRQRLREASRIIGPVMLSDLPDDAARRLAAFRTRTGWADNTGAGTLPATLEIISDVECLSLARLLCEIDAAIVEHILDLARRP
jgi:hypothetical protein